MQLPTAGIPPEILARAPRVWLDLNTGFGRRTIDPKWLRSYRAAGFLEEVKGRVRQRKIDAGKARRIAAAEARERQADEKAAAALAFQKAIEEARSHTNMAISHRAQDACYPRSAAPIIAEVARIHCIAAAEIVGPSRHKLIVSARQHAMYEIRRVVGLSFPRIGRHFGGRDHTTVLNAVRVWPAKAAAIGIPCEPINLPVVKGYTPEAAHG